MANITITENTFNDKASVIRKLYEAPTIAEYAQIEKELQVIKDRLERGSQEYQVVEALEQTSKTHSWEAICATIKALAPKIAELVDNPDPNAAQAAESSEAGSDGT